MPNTPINITVDSGQVYLTQEVTPGFPSPYEDQEIEMSVQDVEAFIVQLKMAVIKAYN